MKGKEAGLFDNKALASLILPLLVEQFLAVLVGMADSIMVASVGEAAVSGVSLVDNVMVLFINLFAALATGGAVIAGQYLGQEDRKSSGKAATQLIWFMTAVSFGIMMLIYLGKNFILHQIFGAIEADVCAHANTYLLIVAASVPFLAISNHGKLRRIHEGLCYHECNQLWRKCPVDLWTSLWNRRCGNPYIAIQSSGCSLDRHSVVAYQRPHSDRTKSAHKIWWTDDQKNSGNWSSKWYGEQYVPAW